MVEAIIWGIPIVNYDLMFQAFARLGGAMNQIVYWSTLLDWKNQTLTPNQNSIYLMPFYDTANAGPIVVEIPPAEGGSPIAEGLAVAHAAGISTLAAGSMTSIAVSSTR